MNFKILKIKYFIIIILEVDHNFAEREQWGPNVQLH